MYDAQTAPSMELVQAARLDEQQLIVKLFDQLRELENENLRLREQNERLEEWKARVQSYRKRYKNRRTKQPYGEKDRARHAVSTAVRAGKLVKPSECQDCKRETTSRLLHAHHYDYAKALDVEWLCADCHGRRRWK